MSWRFDIETFIAAADRLTAPAPVPVVSGSPRAAPDESVGSEAVSLVHAAADGRDRLASVGRYQHLSA
jgi:hypothetical protein